MPQSRLPEYLVPRLLDGRRQAVIYASTSALPALTASNLQRQLDCCRGFAEQSSLAVAAVYEDVAIRDTPLDQRAGLQGALELLRGMADGVLITESIDRIATGHAEVAAIHSGIEAAGAALICVEEQRLGSPTDEFRADIARAIQEYRTALMDEIIEKSVLLSPETRERLQERAQREGRDMHLLADELLAAALTENGPLA